MFGHTVNWWEDIIFVIGFPFSIFVLLYTILIFVTMGIIIILLLLDIRKGGGHNVL